MPRHRQNVTVHWEKMRQIDVVLDAGSADAAGGDSAPPESKEQKFKLDIRPTDVPLPHVHIVTFVTDSILFQFAKWSWLNFVYPPDLLKWTIVDKEEKIDRLTLDDLKGDKRIEVLHKDWRVQEGVTAIMKESRHGTSGYMFHSGADNQETRLSEPEVNRNLRFMLLECGDVCVPDTLVLKHRAMVANKSACVMANSLAMYDPFQNTSTVHKYYKAFAYNGLYFRREWWSTKNSAQIVGMPYIGNCICIGKCALKSAVVKSSIRLFENLTPDVRAMVRLVRDSAHEAIDSEDDDAPLSQLKPSKAAAK